MEKRREDVVAFPVRVVAEGEFRVSLANLVDLVAADKNDVIETVGTERSQRPVKDATPLDLRKTLGRVGRGGHQPNAAPGAGDDGFHGRNGGAMENRTPDLRIANESFLAVFKRFQGFLICRLHLCTSKHHYALGQMRDTKTVVLL